MTELSFKLATNGSIVLGAMVAEEKPLLDAFYWLSQPQSPSTAATQTSLFPTF